MIYFITDTHFRHARMQELCGRPEDFTDRIIKNWQRIVQPDDTVYHLGDVALYKKAVMDIIPTLSGHKKLLLGNHDTAKPHFYIEAGFETVYGKRLTIPVQDGSYLVYLTHHPYHGIVPDGVTAWLCGHCHQRVAWAADYGSVYPISLELQGYKPQTLEEIVAWKSLGS